MVGEGSRESWKALRYLSELSQPPSRLILARIFFFGFRLDLESLSRRRMADFPLPSLPIAPLR